MCKNQHRINVLKLITKDMENDAKFFDGQPFNGKTVATYFGRHGAAISAIANILANFIEEKEEIQRRTRL